MKKISLFLVFLLLIFAIPLTGCKCEEDIKYDISCEFDGERLFGNEKVTFYNFTDNSFSTLKFNLYPNAFREGAKYSPISKGDESRCFYSGLSYGNMEIVSVKENGKNLGFEVIGEDENILNVILKTELFPSETVSVDIEFSLKIARVIARTGINEKTVNLGNFYPILCGIEDGGFYECVYYSIGDPFYSDASDYSVRITVPSSYEIASSGKELSVKISNGKKTAKYEIKKARSFCLVLSKDFKVVKEKKNGIEVKYYYLNDNAVNESLSVAVKGIKTFSELFGDYIYDTFSVVETPFNEGGMEYSGLVMIDAFLEPLAHEEVIVHETAHQWWETAVGNNEIKYGFLDEGLTEYSVVLFYEKNKEYKRTRKSLIDSASKTYSVFCSVFDSLYGKIDTSMFRSLSEYSSSYEYVNIAYVKGCLMNDYLRIGVGDKKYFNSLRRYYKENKYLNVTPSTLVGVFEREGCDTNGFFESFFNGSVIL